MKSISELASTMAAQVTSTASEPRQEITLPPRLTPLEPSDIERVERAMSRVFKITKEPVYGTVSVRDKDGEIISSEYDLIGYTENYERIGEPSDRLREAVLRPATSRHVVAHLTRLATHRRDTRGAAALSVALEEIAGDLGSVSEWAVITACREMRGKPGWYPGTSEILETIRAAETKFNRLFKINPTASPALTAQQPAPAARARSWKETPKPQWQAAEWAGYCAEALGMAEQARNFPAAFDLEFWVTETARRRVEAGASGFEQSECGQAAAHNINADGQNQGQGASL